MTLAAADRPPLPPSPRTPQSGSVGGPKTAGTPRDAATLACADARARLERRRRKALDDRRVEGLWAVAGGRIAIRHASERRDEAVQGFRPDDRPCPSAPGL